MTKSLKPRTASPIGREHQDFGVKAGFLVHDVSRLRRAFFDESMRPYGLTRSQWWVLGQLTRHKGQAMSQVELAKHLDIGKAALGSLVDKLEAGGYVQRNTVPGDRRVKLIAVTPKGHEVTSAMRRIGHDLNLRLFVGLTDAQVHELEETLARVKSNLVGLVAPSEASAEEPPAPRRTAARPRPRPAAGLRDNLAARR